MAFNISKHMNDSSKLSGSITKYGLHFGFLTLKSAGSGFYVYTNEIETG